MSSILSADGYLGIAKQTAKGSAAASSDIFFQYTEGNFPTEITNSQIREGGDDEILNTVVKNSHKEKMSFKILARPRAVAYLFAWLLGDDAVSGGGDPYTHVLTRSSGNRCWLTVRRKITSSVVVTYTDAKIDSITVEGEAGKEVMLTIEMVALTASVGSSEESPTYESSPVFMFYDGNGTYSLDSSVTQLIKKFTFKHYVTSQDGYQSDDILMEDYPDLKFDVDVSLELFVEATDNWKKANYNDQTSPQEDLYSSDVTVDLVYTENVADDREFKIEVEKFVWNPVDLPLKADPESLTETIAGIATKPDSGEMTTVTVKNDLSADLATSGS